VEICTLFDLIIKSKDKSKAFNHSTKGLAMLKVIYLQDMAL
jgi:hypothetical protein